MVQKSSYIIIAIVVILSGIVYFRNQNLDSSSVRNGKYSNIAEVNQANEQIDLANQKVKEIRFMTNARRSIDDIHAVATEMVDHDNLAVQYMKEAEKKGIDLRQVGLVEKLCDSLGYQYQALVNAGGENISSSNRPKTLTERLDEGQEFDSAVSDVSLLIQSAMDW